MSMDDFKGIPVVDDRGWCYDLTCKRRYFFNRRRHRPNAPPRPALPGTVHGGAGGASRWKPAPDEAIIGGFNVAGGELGEGQQRCSATG